MKSLLLFTIVPFLFLSVVSCSKKETNHEVYGDFRFESTHWSRKRFMWPGEDHINSEYKLYFKEKEVDPETIAPPYLLENNRLALDLYVMEIRPLFYEKDSSFVYCMLSGELKTSLVILHAEKGRLNSFPLINIASDTTGHCWFSNIDSIGNGRVMYANYIFDEKTRQIVRRFKPINRYAYNGYDSSNYDGWVYTYYGHSPDHKKIARSFYPAMIGSYPNMNCFFVSDLSNGQTVEVPVMKEGNLLIDSYTQAGNDDYKQWFNRNMEWVEENGKYSLKIRRK